GFFQFTFKPDFFILREYFFAMRPLRNVHVGPCFCPKALDAATQLPVSPPFSVFCSWHTRNQLHESVPTSCGLPKLCSTVMTEFGPGDFVCNLARPNVLFTESTSDFEL